jgi:hypothetical protein
METDSHQERSSAFPTAATAAALQKYADGVCALFFSASHAGVF